MKMAVTTLTSPEALQRFLQVPPPPGTPYSIQLPNSANPDKKRSAIYRHWRYRDSQLLQTLDPRVHTAHNIFEVSAKERPNAKCLGNRKWDAGTSGWGKYEWMTYREVEERRRKFGLGIRELHRKAGIRREKYGVGLWCSNRPEWQIAGGLELNERKDIVC